MILEKLKNKTAIVTGGASGIGKACALEFLLAGANVVIADINRSLAFETVSELKQHGERVVAVGTDVSDPDSVSALVKKTVETFGGADILLNNAAIQINKTIEDTNIEEWNRQLAVNLTGTFLCSKFFLPQLRRSKGCIINMSSVNGYFVEYACAGYCATKAALIGLTKAMAIDHGHEGIRVNCICPGYIDAGLAEGYFESQGDPRAARKDAGKLHALGRIGEATEVGKMAVFLGTEEASFITGAQMVVDGGFGSGLPPKIDQP